MDRAFLHKQETIYREYWSIVDKKTTVDRDLVAATSKRLRILDQEVETLKISMNRLLKEKVLNQEPASLPKQTTSPCFIQQQKLRPVSLSLLSPVTSSCSGSRAMGVRRSVKLINFNPTTAATSKHEVVKTEIARKVNPGADSLAGVEEVVGVTLGGEVMKRKDKKKRKKRHNLSSSSSSSSSTTSSEADDDKRSTLEIVSLDDGETFSA